MFFGNRTDVLPFFLELGQDFSRFFPVGTFFQGFSLFTERFFLFQVGSHCFLHRFEESSFPAEEFIAGSAETFENLDVHLLWSIADGFPFGLKGKDFIGLVFPVGKSSEGVIFHTFHDFANHRLLVQVILFFFFQFFKMLLMTFVDNRRGSLETAPDFFAQVFGYRTDGTEFLMKLLQLVESRNYVGLFSQFFCSFAQASLLFQVFLEVIFAEFIVQLHHVIEFFGVELVSLPQLIYFCYRSLTCFIPFLLQFLKFVVYLVGIFLRFGQELHSFQDTQFLGLVFFLFLFLCSR